MSEPRMIARSVSNGLSGKPAAFDYLAQHHPEFVGCDLSELKFEWGWLVETVTGASGGEKIVLLVNRHGFVEEVGSEGNDGHGRSAGVRCRRDRGRGR